MTQSDADTTGAAARDENDDDRVKREEEEASRDVMVGGPAGCGRYNEPKAKATTKLMIRDRAPRAAGHAAGRLLLPSRQQLVVAAPAAIPRRS